MRLLLALVMRTQGSTPARAGGVVVEVAAGIHKVDGRGMSNGYVVQTDEGLLVVDAAARCTRWARSGSWAGAHRTWC